MNNSIKSDRPFKLFRFLLQSLDPVHVGVGGYRLGRVDLPIAREPGTNIPKLPGTGINGAARHYAALINGNSQCAGQGGDDERGHCGKRDCPICYTFGSLRLENGEEKGAVAGTVRIFDARILLFPVYSMVGPVWVTSPETLRDFGLDCKLPVENCDNVLGSEPRESDASVYVGKELKSNPVLNLGWLMVDVKNYGNDDNSGEIFSLEDLAVSEKMKNLVNQLPEIVKNRVVLVTDNIFSLVVNSNLEVRTSVSIDPKTGAAKQGALFTYEAIPRATFFWLDVVENDFRETFPKNNSQGWQYPIDVISSAIDWFEYLGVGGMGTRGFGRIKKIAREEMM